MLSPFVVELKIDIFFAVMSATCTTHEIKKDLMCAHKMAMQATKRSRLTLDSYFEKAHGSGNEALTQTCTG